MNILIIRLSAIGDVFFCTSLLDGLRRLYPNCQITWLTEPVGAGILREHPLLDDLIILPRKAWVRDFRTFHWIRLARSMGSFIKTLRSRHYELAIDPQGLLKSGIWARAARADRRIGINARDGSAIFYQTVLRLPYSERPPILSEYRALLEQLGGDPDSVRMNLQVRKKDQAEADAFLSAEGNLSPVVFCPFTTRPQKHWFTENWARLGDLLYQRGFGPVVILGGPGDGGMAREISRQMERPVIIAAGINRSIGFALGIIGQARGLVGVDTGLTHAGIAFDLPTVCLFGSTRPYLDTRSPRAKVLFHALACAPCRRHPTCEGRFDCMRLHTPEQVARSLLEIISLQESTPSS